MDARSPVAADYQTTPRSIGWFAGALPKLSFYWRMAGVVWRASRLAKSGRYDDAAWIRSSLKVVESLEAIGATIRIENVAALTSLPGPVVIVGNHMSTLETFVLPSVIVPHKRMTFVVKRQLVEMPVFKHVMISRNPVVVGRASPRDDLRIVMEEGEAKLRAGLSIVVFPQTTRSTSWIPGEFNSIAVKLARRAGVPIIPLALRTDAWGIGSLVKDCGPIRPDLPIRFRFGDALEIVGNGRQTQDAIVRFLNDNLSSWGVPVIEGE